jgi:hypothetical protein
MYLGTKFDSGKSRYDLLPPNALEEVAKVLTYGAAKYAPDNWRFVPDAENRYFAAAQRHLWALRRGESHDPESGISHIAHAITSLLFLEEILNHTYENQSRNSEGSGEPRLDQSEFGDQGGL